MTTLDERLRRMRADLPSPDDDFEARMIDRSQTVRARAARSTRTFRLGARSTLRMRVLAAAVALLVAVGIAGATTTLPIPLIGSKPGGGGIPVASESVRAALEQNELLRDAPWLHQPHGSPSLDEVEALPSLVFPAGTTYDEAIEALYVAVKRFGDIPVEATLGPPLPKDIVFARSLERFVLSLTAPYGYDIGTGNILLPSLRWDDGMKDEDIDAARLAAGREGRIIPEGAKVEGNLLDPCQVMVNDKRGQACS